MPRLTVVFEYQTEVEMKEAARMFKKSNISNLVEVAEYDAVTAHDNLHERFLITGDEPEFDLLDELNPDSLEDRVPVKSIY